jgi:hypothetical protein
MILNGPSIRNRKVKICATGKRFVCTKSAAASVAEAKLASIRHARPTVNAIIRGMCPTRHGTFPFLLKKSRIGFTGTLLEFLPISALVF